MGIVRSYREFRKNKDGVVAVEMALIALPFIVMILAAVQLAVIFLTIQTLDLSVYQASRLVQTGQVHAAGMDKEDFGKFICETVAYVPDCEEDLEFAVQSFPSIEALDGITLFTPEGRPILTEAYEPGVGGDVVMVNVQVPMPIPFSDFFGGRFQTDSNLIVASNTFRNEFFDN